MTCVRLQESEDEADKKKNGPVDAKKCEELLTHSTEKLMSGRQVPCCAVLFARVRFHAARVCDKAYTRCLRRHRRRR